MPLNLDAVGTLSDPAETSWDSKDAILYALGVGSGTDEQPFVTENSIDLDQEVLPTMAVVIPAIGGGMSNLGDFNWAMLVHGEQGVRLHQPIPVSGTVSSQTEITGIYDKGKGALVVMETRSTDAATGEPLFDTMMSAFIRGEGGFGGDRGPSGPAERAAGAGPRPLGDLRRPGPTRRCSTACPATATRCTRTRSSPPWPASTGRSCTGCAPSASPAGRSCTRCVTATRPASRSMDGRFSSPVFPGESLTVNMWVDGGEAVFQTTGDDGRVVLDAGKCTFTT